MGTVSTVSVGSKVTATDFNNLRDPVLNMLGPPTGAYVDDGSNGTIEGYNEFQQITQNLYSTGEEVTIDQWNAVIDNVVLIHNHRTGTDPSSPALPAIVLGDKITASKYNDIVSVHNANYNDRFTVDSANVSIDTATTGSLAAGWNGNQRHVFNIIFASEDDKFAFFNTGSSLRITASATYGASESKSVDWRNMVNNLEDVEISAKGTTYTNSSYAGGTKLVSYQGWYYLDSLPNGTPDTIIYKFDSSKDGGTAEYNENFCQYRFRRVSDLVYSIFLDFRDIDTGEPNDFIDENVQTVINTTVSVIYPTNASLITAVKPTFTANTDTIGFTASYP